nr:mechanosensitive ion channel [Ktedonobacterales bacterium]
MSSLSSIGYVRSGYASDPTGTLRAPPLAALVSYADTVGIRAGLTGAVLLVALLAGTWLARRAGRVVEQEENGTRGGRLEKLRERIERRGSLGPWLGRITRVSIWIAALAAIAVIWLYGQGIPAQTPRELGRELGDLVVRLGGSLVVLAVALAFGRILQGGLVASLRRGRVNRNLALLCGRTLYISTLIVGLIAILAIWGTGLVLPVTLIGALTVALSLSLQDILKNLVAGIYLLIEHPFVIGEWINSASYSGEVQDIQLRVTVLRTVDNQKVLIPNALLFTSPVVNMSANKHRRAGIAITVPDAGPDSINAAEAHILTALADVSEILREPKPQVVVSRVAAGKLELRVEFWLPTGDTAREGGILSAAIEQVRTRLR